MKMKLYLRACSIGLLFFCLIMTAGIQSAHATATLRLHDGVVGNPYFDIVDEGVNDDSINAPGVITYNGTYSVFNVLVATGVQSGTNTLPALGLNTIEVTSFTSGGTLIAWFSNNGFGPTSSPAWFDMHGSGNVTFGNATVNFYSYIDNADTLFGEGTLLGSLGSYTAPPSFNGDTYGSISFLSNSYSLTTKTIIDVTAGTMMQTTANVAVVPEPVSSALFSIGAATLGFRLFRKEAAV